MTSKDVRAFCTATPFEPFVIRLTDGRTFPVRHPEFLTFSNSIRAVNHIDDGGARTTLNAAVIATIEFDVPAGPERSSE